jgi:hypothetical protein
MCKVKKGGKSVSGIEPMICRLPNRRHPGDGLPCVADSLGLEGSVAVALHVTDDLSAFNQGLGRRRPSRVQQNGRASAVIIQ